MKPLAIGYSPCPNDTFIFYALVHNRIDLKSLKFKEILEDVETLNRMAEKGRLDITKVSYHAFAHLRDKYCLLRSGGALGIGCGPLVVAKEAFDAGDLSRKRIATPGKLTTAHLLFQLFANSKNIQPSQFVPMPFSEIMDSVKNSRVDAGLIIHEGRFTYQAYGLKEVIDLGQWWERETGFLIPLGCIIAKRELGKDLISRIDSCIRESILYAINHRDEPAAYIKRHSAELQDSVIGQHINLYVNAYSLDLGDRGISSVKALLKMAEDKGIIGISDKDLFLE